GGNTEGKEEANLNLRTKSLRWRGDPSDVEEEKKETRTRTTRRGCVIGTERPGARGRRERGGAGSLAVSGVRRSSGAGSGIGEASVVSPGACVEGAVEEGMGVGPSAEFVKGNEGVSRFRLRSVRRRLEKVDGQGNGEVDEGADFIPDVEEDDEATLDAEEALACADGTSPNLSTDAELAALEADADVPIEELIRQAYGGQVGEGDSAGGGSQVSSSAGSFEEDSEAFSSDESLEGGSGWRDFQHSGGRRVKDMALLLGSAHSQARRGRGQREDVSDGGDADVEYEGEEEEEEDDEDTLEEEERLQQANGGVGAEGAEAEVNELEKEGEMPLSELLTRYG
ncbi:unnamed protein product, partial [Choristocarpus tenellus]